MARVIDLQNPVSDHPLNDGLVSWWLPLRATGYGTTLFDLCKRNDGTLISGPTWTAGRDGFGALSFDGSNDYVETGAISPSPQTLSFECWVRLSSTATEQTLLAITNGGATPSQYSQLLRFGSSAAVYCFDGAPKLTASASLGTSAGVWYHVVGVWQNLGSQTVYVDGVQRATGAIGNLFTGWSPSPRVSFGVIATLSASAARFSGDFGFARFYNRALSAADVASLYDQTLRGHPDTIRRYSSARWFVGSVATSPPPPPASSTFIPAFAAGWGF